jgi:hypothetical protein
MEGVLTREEVAELVRSWFEGVTEQRSFRVPDEELMRTALMDILNASVSR